MIFVATTGTGVQWPYIIMQQRQFNSIKRFQKTTTAGIVLKKQAL